MVKKGEQAKQCIHPPICRVIYNPMYPFFPFPPISTQQPLHNQEMDLFPPVFIGGNGGIWKSATIPPTSNYTKHVHASLVEELPRLRVLCLMMKFIILLV